MRFFLKFSLLLIMIMILTSILLPRRYELTFPRDPGPELDNKVRTNYLEYLEEHHPQIVLLGDSTLGASIDVEELSLQTNKSIYEISIPGSASALWYLIMKSNIAESKYKPEMIIIVFRDSILTTPGYRVHGSYFELLDEYADHNEPLIMQNSYINFMSPIEIFAEKYFPLYVARADIRRSIDARIRYFTPPYFVCDQNCTDQALSEIFAGADLEPKALVDAVDAAESYLYTPERLDFETQVDISYLPEMIRIANENNIKLVFVRVEVKSHANDPKVDSYIHSLTEYLNEKNVSILDYGKSAQLTDEHFLDSIHLNPKGEVVFTQIVADGLNQLFVGK